MLTCRKLWPSILSALVLKMGRLRPDKCYRLGQIVTLSAEFSDVLRNPRSNFTASLARTAGIVAGTCVGVGKHALGIIDHAYDWVIVDEAARFSYGTCRGNAGRTPGTSRRRPPAIASDISHACARENVSDIGRIEARIPAYKQFQACVLIGIWQKGRQNLEVAVPDGSRHRIEWFRNASMTVSWKLLERNPALCTPRSQRTSIDKSSGLTQ